MELLVVIAIVALATAGVSLGLRDSSEFLLDREADRLAALLEAGRAQSRSSGVPVHWRLTEEGFRFEGLPVDSLPTRWQSNGIVARVLDAQGRPQDKVLLGPEPILAAQQVQLSVERPTPRSLRVASDGLRPFSVSP